MLSKLLHYSVKMIVKTVIIMRKEFGDGTSGRDKSSTKRSNRTTHELNVACSPYQSTERLDEMNDSAIEELVEELESKSATKRSAAVSKLLGQFQNVHYDVAVCSVAESILEALRRTTQSPKCTVEERLDALYAGTLLVMCIADDKLNLYDTWADVLWSLLSPSRKERDPHELYEAASESLAWIFACDDQLAVASNVSMSTAVAQLLNEGDPRFQEDHRRYAVYLSLCSFCCESTLRNKVKSAFVSLFDDADYDVVVNCVEGLSMLAQRFPGVVEPTDVEYLLKVSSKEAGKVTKRNLGQSTRALIKFLTEKLIPQESILFRQGHSITLKGFVNIHLLFALRNIVGDRLQRQLAHSLAVRRVLDVSVDVTQKVDKDVQREERSLQNDAKEELIKGRGKNRTLKKSILQGDEAEFE